MKRDQKEVAQILGSNPTVQAYRELSVANQVRCFLSGGAVRDAFIGRDRATDFDFFLSGPPDKLEAVVKQYAELHQSGKIVGASSPLNVDAVGTHDVLSVVRQFDFTMNGIIFDCSQGEILDPLGGMADINAKKLKTPSRAFFVASPRNFLRPFRFAQEFGFTIDAAILELVGSYGDLVLCNDAFNRTKSIGDLVYYLAIPDIDSTFPALWSSRLLVGYLPFLRLLERVASDNAHGCTALEWNGRVVAQTSKILAQLGSDASARFAKRVIERKVINNHRCDFADSLLARVRVAALLTNCAKGVLQFDGSVTAPFDAPEFELRVMMRLVSYFESYAVTDPRLIQFIRNAAKIAVVAQEMFSAAKTSRFSAATLDPKDALRRDAAFLVAAQLLATETVSPRSRDEMVAGIIGYLKACAG